MNIDRGPVTKVWCGLVGRYLSGVNHCTENKALCACTSGTPQWPATKEKIMTVKVDNVKPFIREKFEAWIRKEHPSHSLERQDGEDGDYFSAGTQHKWLGFFAATPILRSENPFQHRVKPWLLKCFGEQVGLDKNIRAWRFIEEAIELVQAGGMTEAQVHRLVRYVFSRPVGELKQEVGGVMTTLASFCIAHDIDLEDASDEELHNVWLRIPKIRARQATKPSPYDPPQPEPVRLVAIVDEQLDANCARVTWTHNPVPNGSELLWDHGDQQ